MISASIFQILRNLFTLNSPLWYGIASCIVQKYYNFFSEDFGVDNQMM